MIHLYLEFFQSMFAGNYSPKTATQKHVSALQETKTTSAVKSTPRSQGCQQNKPNYSTQPKRPPFTRQNVKQQHVCLNCALNHHRDTTCPAHKANFCGKKGHWSASLNSTARKVKASKRPDDSQQPETNSMHLNMPERQTVRAPTKQLTLLLTL